MVPEWLVIATNASIVFLCLQWFVICAAVLVVLWFVYKKLRDLVHKLEAAFVTIRAAYARLITAIQRALAAIRAPFIWAISKAEGAKAFTSSLQSPTGLRGR